MNDENENEPHRAHPHVPCSDVMTGRGIDQVLPHPGDPALYESYVRDAREYAQLAEFAHGPISRPVDFDYIWGDALLEMKAPRTDVRIINLETAITESEDYWPGKPVCSTACILGTSAA